MTPRERLITVREEHRRKSARPAAQAPHREVLVVGDDYVLKA